MKNAREILKRDAKQVGNFEHREYFIKPGGGDRAYQDWIEMDPHEAKETYYRNLYAMEGKLGDFTVTFIHQNPRCTPKPCPTISLWKTTSAHAKREGLIVIYNGAGDAPRKISITLG